MQLETKAVLEEIRQASLYIQQFVTDKEERDYTDDVLLRSAVERQFQIVGEAMNRLGKLDEESLGLIRNSRRIIAFRNILVHDYDRVDEGIVWDIIQKDIPILLDDVSNLLLKADKK